MTTLECIQKHIADNGYDGLYNADNHCGCAGERPCDVMQPDCEFAYAGMCSKCGIECFSPDQDGPSICYDCDGGE